MKLVAVVAVLVATGCSSKKLAWDDYAQVCEGVGIEDASSYVRGAVIAFERFDTTRRAMLDRWTFDEHPARYQVVACIDVVEKVKVRDCTYDGGLKSSLWNARVEIRAVEATTGIELARTTRTLEHDTTNVVSRGCPLAFDATAIERLPSYEREVSELLAHLVASTVREQQTSGSLDHLVGVSAR